MARITQDLNTVWDYRVGQGSFSRIKVPFSSLPVGLSTCRKTFDALCTDKRTFLFFEGITYHAWVNFNGVDLGQMLPYCEYRFEITSLLKEKDNLLTVELSDIDVTFGPSEGWENYGGIIRPVWVEYAPDAILTDVVFTSFLSEEYTKADCHISVETDGFPSTGLYRYTLTDPTGRVVYSGDSAESEYSFSVEHPLLWSPDFPNLYTLETALMIDGEPQDVDCRKVGFKEFTVKGKRFYLNGVPTFLTGVCRHDTWGDQGHTLTPAQMEQDMRMIKEQGVNYVRLVHYPHIKRIVELADEIGLLISEEPGLWWSDMHNPTLCADSLEVLKRTVIRDRSNVSVAFWLAFNECIFTPEFIQDSSRICRETDPTRLVSGANCMIIEMTKEHFTKNGFDFYTMHPYTDDPNKLWPSVKELTDKPVLFTEWGGHFIWESKELFRRYVGEMVKMWRNPEEEPVLAGATIWCWSDIYEFSRAEPGCRDGILYEGLTDLYRNPHDHFHLFKTLFAEINAEPKQEWQMEVCGQVAEGNYLPIPMVNTAPEYNEDAAYEKMKELWSEPVTRFYYYHKKNRRITVGPILPEDPLQIGNLPIDCAKKPFVVCGGSKVTIPVNETGKQLWVVGNSSMPYGYPVYGAYGAPVGEYIIRYADGTEDTFPLRNGYEITTAHGIFGPSRLNPVAANAPRALTFEYDRDCESYTINMMSLPLQEKEVESLTLQVSGEKFALLFYAVTLEK